MPFAKGHKLGKGRPKGSKNEITGEIKEGITLFVHCNRHKLNEWLDRVAEKDPARALEIILSAAEFVTPKMQRIEADIRADQTIIKIYEPFELLVNG
jgi:hypothetical protein